METYDGRETDGLGARQTAFDGLGQFAAMITALQETGQALGLEFAFERGNWETCGAQRGPMQLQAGGDLTGAETFEARKVHQQAGWATAQGLIRGHHRARDGIGQLDRPHWVDHAHIALGVRYIGQAAIG